LPTVNQYKMAATQQQITDYLTYIKYAQSVYMDDLNRKERLGHSDLFNDRLRNTILGYYVTIMVDYFYQSDYSNNNFFTTEEVVEVISRINRICDSNYNIEL